MLFSAFFNLIYRLGQIHGGMAGFSWDLLFIIKQITMQRNYDPKEGGEQEANEEAAAESTQDNQGTTQQGSAEEETDPE